ncbi:MAG TPA: BNR repeat-containing protein [Polyangia bacterium]|nr:BNR repeat-containing protein [Polyangia bacterium]
MTKMQRAIGLLAFAIAAAGCGASGSGGAGGKGGSSGANGGAAGSGPAGAGGAAGATGGATGIAGTTGAAGTTGGAGTSGGAGTTGAGGSSGGAGTTGAGGSAAGGRGGTTGASGAGGGAGTMGAGGASAGSGGAGGRGGNGGIAGGGRGGGAGTGAAGSSGSGGAGTIVKVLDIADVWSGHPVGFSLVTTPTRQYVAYYDTNRDMTVAQRALTSDTWTFTRLPTTVGWDSHNYIAMDLDSGGFIHVSGNMHAVPLIYFRGAQANEAGSLSGATMVGSNESSCTYPLFFHDTANNLVFNYRDGSSGSGNHIFNIYNTGTKTWRRLLNAPFTDGQGARNAYPVGPVLGPDAFWHMVWVWRETPDAETNHDLSYARSRDLVQWQTAAGTNLTLPITLATSDIVDPVPQNGGMINNNTKVGFDAQNRPIVAYHKFDSAGNTQLYNARFENGKWVPHKTSSWNYRWAFSGQGTLVFEIQVEPVKVDAAGNLTQRWYHAQYGGWNAFALDPTTLAATAMLGRSLPYPVSLETVESTTAGMHVRWQDDSGAGPDPTVLYMLRWETLDSNRDMRRSPIPPPTRLRLYGFKK